MIPINKPILGAEEREAVSKILESGGLTNPSVEGGPQVRDFERELASYHQVRNAVAVNSGTSALLISLIVSGVGPGDEVIVPSFTFVATASAVMILGAKPVFVDIEPGTHNIDPAGIRRSITGKTKAIIPVDLYGLPANMPDIREIASTKGIALIEDACQAQGATQGGKMAATLGDMGCLSFYPGKVMTTGEGGAIITDDDELAEKMRRIRTHGQVKGYDPVAVGGNFRLPEMEAAIGRVQLRRLPGFLRDRAKNALRLFSAMDGAGVGLPLVPDGNTHNWYLFTIEFRGSIERDTAKAALNNGGYGATVYYPVPVHRTPLYRHLDDTKLVNTDLAAERVLSLPVNPIVKEADIDSMAMIVKKTLPV